MLKGSWLGGSCLHSWQGRGAGFGSVGGTAALGLALVRFAVRIVVEGRGLTALQPGIPGFGLEIVALCNFSIKVPVRQIWP